MTGSAFVPVSTGGRTWAEDPSRRRRTGRRVRGCGLDDGLLSFTWSCVSAAELIIAYYKYADVKASSVLAIPDTWN